MAAKVQQKNDIRKDACHFSEDLPYAIRVARLVDILHEADGDTHVACDKGGTIGATTGGELYVVGSALSGRVRRRRPITSHTGLDAILAA